MLPNITGSTVLAGPDSTAAASGSWHAPGGGGRALGLVNRTEWTSGDGAGRTASADGSVSP